MARTRSERRLQGNGPAARMAGRRPPLAWKIDGLGSGYSAPSVSNGRMFGMSHRGGEEVVWALSEADGKEIWVTPLGPAQSEGMPQGSEGPGARRRSTGNSFTSSAWAANWHVFAVADGTVVWRRNLTTDFGGSMPTWRYNESPLVDGDKLVCTPGGEEALMVALDKLTGDVIWKSKALDTTSSGERADTGPAEPRGGFGGRPGGPPPGGGQRGGALAAATGVPPRLSLEPRTRPCSQVNIGE